MRSQPLAQSEPESQAETLRRMAQADNYNTWLLDRSRPYLGRRVLDVGAGLGTFTELAADGREVVALEPEAAFATDLRTRFAGRPNVQVVEAEAGELEESEPFDSVICFNVLEHIPDDEGALRQFHSRLAPGGHLLLLVPAHPFLFGAIDRTVHHERRYRREPLRRLLEQTGFAVQTARYVNPLGALGWLVSGRVLGRGEIPTGPLRLYDSLVPLLRALDRLALPFGLSVWAVARRVA
jgi:2-polyprenyl-3-methyl-5-hydroxy-6-metoxy-1,4-benzoquinol methylase